MNESLQQKLKALWNKVGLISSALSLLADKIKSPLTVEDVPHKILNPLNMKSCALMRGCQCGEKLKKTLFFNFLLSLKPSQGNSFSGKCALWADVIFCHSSFIKRTRGTSGGIWGLSWVVPANIARHGTKVAQTKWIVHWQFFLVFVNLNYMLFITCKTPLVKPAVVARSTEVAHPYKVMNFLKTVSLCFMGSKYFQMNV